MSEHLGEIGPPHETVVKFQHAWSEWLPSCSCGWVGSYRKSKASSEREAEDHKASERIES